MSRLQEHLVRAAEQNFAGTIRHDLIRPLLQILASSFAWRDVEVHYNALRDWLGVNSLVLATPTSATTLTQPHSDYSGNNSERSSLYSSFAPAEAYPVSRTDTLNSLSFSSQGIGPSYTVPSYHEQIYSTLAQSANNAHIALHSFEQLNPVEQRFSVSQSSKVLAKIYICWICGVGCSRAGEFRTHFRKFCGSRIIWKCNRCGNCAQSKQLALDHSKKSETCKQHGHTEVTLPYDRQAFSSPWWPQAFSDLDGCLRHAIKYFERSNTPRLADLSAQIRSLLLHGHMRPQVEALCSHLPGGAVAVIGELWWCYEDHHFKQIIEQLGYGAIDDDPGVPNLGIRSCELTGFLRMVIEDGFKNVPSLSHCRISPPISLVNPSDNVETWHGMHNARAESSAIDSASGETNMLSLPRSKSPKTFTATLTRRSKRPPSDGSIQLPDSIWRGRKQANSGTRDINGNSHLGSARTKSLPDDRARRMDLFQTFLLPPSPEPFVSHLDNYFNGPGVCTNADNFHSYSFGEPSNLPQRSARSL